MIDALILEAIRRGIPTPARQAADRLDIRRPFCDSRIPAAQGIVYECMQVI